MFGGTASREELLLRLDSLRKIESRLATSLSDDDRPKLILSEGRVRLLGLCGLPAVAEGAIGDKGTQELASQQLA